MNSSSVHQRFDEACMERALQLAELGRGYVEPNPMVGCVISRDGQIIGDGYHERYGGPHAEVRALDACDNPRGATLWVTLEPCCHRGKTPPCTEAIITAGVRRVVVAHRDPFPQVSGGGVAALQNAGVEVEVGLCGHHAERLNAPYLKLTGHQRPWVIAKWAMTLDGKIASRSGESRWISSEASRAIVHQLRGCADAILIGYGTAPTDDPLLTARPPGPRVATRIVVDSEAMLAPSSRLVQTSGQAPVLIAVGKGADATRCADLEKAGCEVLHCDGESHTDQLNSLLSHLGRRRMTNLLVEGGASVFGSLLKLQEIDEFHTFVAPKLLGGRAALSPIGGFGFESPSDALPVQILTTARVGDDIHIHGLVERQRSSDV